MGSIGITTDQYVKPKTTIHGHGSVDSYTNEELKELSNRKVYQSFHSPSNENNRFMSSRSNQEKAILRDTQRPHPYTTQPNPWDPGKRTCSSCVLIGTRREFLPVMSPL